MGGVEEWGCMGCGGRNPPVTASPCQPPLGKGAEGTGVRIATASVRTGFAMTGFYGGCRGMSGGRTEASAPTDDKKCGKTGRRGRRPLRRGCKRCGGRATARVAPTEGYASISYTYIIKQYFFAMSRKFFAAEVNLRQRRGIFRWDWEGYGPEKSPLCGRRRCKETGGIRALFAMQKHSKIRNVPFPRPYGATGNDAQKTSCTGICAFSWCSVPA